jgi:hypothetical protein
MLEHPEQYAVPYALLVLRLPLQVGLLTLIARSTGARYLSGVIKQDSVALRAAQPESKTEAMHAETFG